MGWDGSLTPVCSLGNSYSHAALLGALADRLLIARALLSGGVEVVQRYIPLLHPLLLGWATLAASNILPGMPAVPLQHWHTSGALPAAV